MAESIVQVTEGSGKKLHTNSRTVGANTVEDEYIVQGLPFFARYTVSRAVAVSTATANDHLIQVMAGASLNVYITRIRLYQGALATTASVTALGLYRLTTAGTGGTALTPAPYDTTDSASGATAMQLPTAKGTEGVLLWGGTTGFIQTVPTSGSLPFILDLDFRSGQEKLPRIAAGTANGIALKLLAAVAAGTVYTVVDLFEANY